MKDKILSLEDYMDNWNEDSKIDYTKIGDESLKIPSLHSKYMNCLSKERITYKKLLERKKKLEMDLEDYYTGKLDGKDINREPFQLTETKTSSVKRVQSDSEMIKMNIAILQQEEIVLFLKDIIQSIHNRNFSIKNYIDYNKFLNGN